MSGNVERINGTPPLVDTNEKLDDIFLYGHNLAGDADGNSRNALVYGFCFQGHCYRLSIPVQFRWTSGNGPEDAVGCGFDFVDTDYKKWRMWRVEKTTAIKRIERRHGTVEELLLDFNLPGRNPATLTYSAKVAIAGNAGKIYE